MAKRNDWLLLKEAMIKAGFEVETKGKSKNEYMCKKDNTIIVDIIYNRGAYTDFYIFDNIGNMTYYHQFLHSIDIDKIVNISNGEYEYLKSYNETEE